MNIFAVSRWRDNKYEFCARYFLITRSKTGGKNTGWCFSIQLKTTCKNSGTFEENKKKHKIVTNSTLFALTPSFSMHTCGSVPIVLVLRWRLKADKFWTLNWMGFSGQKPPRHRSCSSFEPLWANSNHKNPSNPLKLAILSQKNDSAKYKRYIYFYSGSIFVILCNSAVNPVHLL